MKRSILTYILWAAIILVITMMVFFNYIPKDKTAQSNIPLAPSILSGDTRAPFIPPDDKLTLSPSSSLLPLHVSESKALVLYDQGLKLYYQRQFPEALVFFNQALAIDVQCYEALNAKGATLAFQGRYDQGLALIQHALDLNPLFVYGYFNRGLANELAGRWDQAITAYPKALQLDERDTWSYYGIASIYGRLGNVDKVLEYLKPAITLDPDVKAVARDEQDFNPVSKDERFQTLVKP